VYISVLLLFIPHIERVITIGQGIFYYMTTGTDTSTLRNFLKTFNPSRRVQPTHLFFYIGNKTFIEKNWTSCSRWSTTHTSQGYNPY